ncbi:MAG: MFS transporter, partial [Eubacterium sp.]
MPNIAPQQKGDGEEVKTPMPKALYFLAFYMFLAQAASLVTVTNMAIFVNSEKLGDPSLLGITMALLTFAGFIAGFILSYVKKIFKNATPMVACILMAGGFILLSTAHNMPVAMISNSLIGLGYGFMIPSIFIAIAQKVPGAIRQKAISIASAAMYFGCFATAYIQQWIGIISGNPSQRFMFLMFGVGAAIAAAGC